MSCRTTGHLNFFFYFLYRLQVLYHRQGYPDTTGTVFPTYYNVTDKIWTLLPQNMAINILKPGVDAQLAVCQHLTQAHPRLTLASGIFFHGDFHPFLLIQENKLSVTGERMGINAGKLIQETCPIFDDDQLKIISYYSQTCLKQAAKGNTKIACVRQVLA